MMFLKLEDVYVNEWFRYVEKIIDCYLITFVPVNVLKVQVFIIDCIMTFEENKFELLILTG